MLPVRFKQVLSVAALLALGGCGSQGSTAMNPSQSASRGVLPAPAQVLNVTEGAIAAATEKVGIRLNGEAPFTNPKYGRVLGYFNGKTNPTSQVVHLTAAMPVVFFNVDASAPHTAAFLGNATKNNAPWPSSFNGGTTQSPAGTVISTALFTTGTLTHGTKSLKYNSGPPGFYMFGCQFHYTLDGMRTVIVVQ